MRFQPGDIVTIRSNEFMPDLLRGRRGTIVSIVSVDSWCHVGPLDKYDIELEDQFTFFKNRYEIWGDNLELCVLDTLAAIRQVEPVVSASAEPKLKVGDRVLLPFNHGIGMVKDVYIGIFGPWECRVEAPVFFHCKGIHETNLVHASILDEIVNERA